MDNTEPDFIDDWLVRCNMQNYDGQFKSQRQEERDGMGALVLVLVLVVVLLAAGTFYSLVF